MQRFWFLLPLLAWLAVFSACGRPEAVDSPAPASAPPAPQGQPKLPVIKLWLGAAEVEAEQAISRSQIEQGLMFRESLGKNEGMLFVFTRPSRLSFWMRNTSVPLSIAYLDPEGVILEIHDMQPFDETPISAGSNRVQFALEMNQGWFARNQIGAGTVVRTEKGSLQETYFAGR